MKALVVFGLLAGCYREYGPAPVTPMGNVQPEPVAVAGPPGGAVDPGYAYDQAQDPAMPGYPAGYAEGYPQGTEAGAPADPYAAESGGGGDGMGPVTDAQINATLAPYGEWVENEEYGRVWRPYATVVGQNFTPYETCGSWVWTDYGWTFTCDLDWGWLPFHYGYWDWFDNSWCWIPDYTWGPGWVDWRYGNGYVGWRPQRPRRDLVRDHRRQAYQPRPSRDSDWRFIPEHSLGRHVRGNTVATSVGLDNTRAVARPPVRGSNTIAAAHLFGRRGSRPQALPYTGPNSTVSPQRPAYRGQSMTYPRTFDSRAYPRGQGPRYPSRGTYQPSRGAYQPSRGAYQPSRGGYQQPSRNTYQPPSGAYRPSRTYQPPTRTYQPSRGTPSRTYTPPSRTYTPSRSYSPPSRSSGSSSYSRPSSSSGSSYRSSSSSSGSSYRSSSSGSSSRGSSSSGSSSRGSSGGGSRGRR